MYKVGHGEGPVIPAKAGIQPDYPFIQVPPAPITFLGHLAFPRSPPSLDRPLPGGEALWIPAFAGTTGVWERIS